MAFQSSAFQKNAWQDTAPDIVVPPFISGGFTGFNRTIEYSDKKNKLAKMRLQNEAILLLLM